MRKWICMMLIVISTATTAAALDDGLKKDISDAIIKGYNLDPQSVKIEFRKIRLLAEAGDYDSLSVEPATNARPVGRVIIKASLFKSGELIESGQVSVNINSFINVMVATDRIDRNALLAPESMTMESRDVTYLSDKPLTSPDEIVGRRTRRLIAKGNILTYANTEIVPTVEVGREVTILYRSGALEISATGTALENGYTGESIRVRNEQSKKTIEAIINNEQTVHVTP